MKNQNPYFTSNNWIGYTLRIGIFICILFGTTQAIIKPEDDLYAQITFENGYQNDTVDVKINDSLIGKGFIVTSDAERRVSSFKIMLKKTATGLMATNTLNSSTTMIPMRDNQLNLKVVVNGFHVTASLDLSIGKYIGVQKFRKDIIVTNQSYIEKKYD